MVVTGKILTKVPILFIVFNRPHQTKKVFDVIKLYKPDRLYISADAARENNDTDSVKCNAVKEIIKVIDWPCQVYRLYQDNNLGCGIAIREAFKWFFSNEREGVILEDDCVPDLSFFSFASEMLVKYRNNKKIISVNGSNLGYELMNGDSYCFSRYMNMWGWATWADRANKIDYTLELWKKVNSPLIYFHKKMSNNFFDIDINWYKLWQHKFNFIVSNQNFTWDWQWVFHQIENNQLSIVPAVNLVTNIGFDEHATHTHESNNPSANIVAKELTLPYKASIKIKPDITYEENFVKWVWCYHKRTSFFYFILSKIKRIFT